MTARSPSRGRRAALGLFCAALCLPAGTAFGQTYALPAFQLERFEFNPGARASLVNAGGLVLRENGFRFSLAGHYESEPLVAYRGDQRLGAVVGDRVTAHLMGAYGVADRFEFGFELPIIAFQEGDDLAAEQIGAAAQTGLGTPQLYARFSLLSEDRGAPVSLAAGISTGLPLGSEVALAREPGLQLTPRLGVSKSFGILSASAEGFFQYRPVTQLGLDEFGSAVGFTATLATTGDGVRGELSGRGLLPLAGTSPDLELLAGVRVPVPVVPGLEVYALGGPGMGTMPGSPAFRVAIGAAFANEGGHHEPPPPPKPDVCAAGQAQPVEQCPSLDKDGDGIANGQDRCATEPEDHDGFEDQDGCPDPDNDQDAILDAADKCPEQKGEASFEGCPPPDKDADGVLDADDKCPAEPGLKEKQGCPFRDGDQDGIEDAIDACPAEAGPPETRGCPVKDADGDGVPDHLDNCVDQKGPADNQGCPKKIRQLVVITREKLIIKDKVYFATAKARVLPRSYRLLDQIAKVIKDHPAIPKVIIEGHTDSRGRAETNRKLSQARAEAVRDYLVRKGKVDPARLEAKGYGPDRPADTNATAKGRENNRRVEFTVVDAPPQKSTLDMIVPLVPSK